ncbi:MAG TPA: hypothetical protein VGL38_08700 [bacterium]
MYQKNLEDEGLLDEACKRTPSDSELIGGSSDEETMAHFAHRFAASCARVEYLILDPSSKFQEESSDILTLLSEGQVSILDVPCGCGAAVLSMIATVADLRQSGVLPKLPLNVDIVGGDISPKAAEMYQKQLAEISEWLTAQGIHLTRKAEFWDAKRPTTTAQLVDVWLDGRPRASGQYLVVVAAFGGAMKSQFNDFSRTFNHVAERLYQGSRTLLWVEPGMTSSEKLLDKVADWFRDKISWLKPKGEPQPSIRFDWFHPIKAFELHGTILVREFRSTQETTDARL